MLSLETGGWHWYVCAVSPVLGVIVWTVKKNSAAHGR